MSEVDGTRLDDARDISESRGGLAPSPLPVRLYRARSVRNRCQCGYDLSIVRVSANVYMADQLGQRQQAFVLNKTHSFTSPLTLTAWAWFAYRRQRFGLIHDPRTCIFFLCAVGLCLEWCLHDDESCPGQTHNTFGLTLTFFTAAHWRGE